MARKVSTDRNETPELEVYDAGTTLDHVRPVILSLGKHKQLNSDLQDDSQRVFEWLRESFDL